jgi:hypothetical protein
VIIERRMKLSVHEAHFRGNYLVRKLKRIGLPEHVIVYIKIILK